MKIRGFITHKQAETYSDCADYFAVNSENRKIAVSDGISQSFSPSEWSRILVESYIEEKWAPEQDLKPLQSQWLNEVRENLKKLQEQGAVTYMTTPMTVMTAMPISTEIWANLHVRSFLPAPMLWPTRVVAAFDTPCPGI